MKPQIADTQWIDDVFASPDPWAKPTHACPDQDRLWAAANAELPPRERREILDHAASCRYCTESWRLALRLRDTSEMPLWAHFWTILRADLRFLAELPERLARLGPALQACFAPRPGTARRLVCVGATCMVALVGASTLLRQSDSPPQMRGGDVAITTMITAEESLPRDAFVLTWSGPARASYDLRVTTAQGQPVDSAQELERTEYQVPEKKLRDLRSGTLLRWEVSNQGGKASFEARLE